MDILSFLFKKRPIATAPAKDKPLNEPSHSVSFVGNGAPSSQLHKEILANPDNSFAKETPGDQNKLDDDIPLSLRLNIGSRLAEMRANILANIKRLMPLVDMSTASALETWRTSIERLTCRIAFLGQINAGKSSLISSLVEKPDLLPASINPWTTVVTNVHFGVEGTPSTGASFVFFTNDEWTHLSKGGRIRELTDRAFPNFNWSALEEQIEIMQRRAEARLGPRFRSLLGTTHIHAEIAPGLLVRYVGAGSHTLQGPEGEFSDITKLANVYFDLGPFLFPTILIDTPGINDPFLVRDEITRQCLDDVDVCVVVVTARQPLSTSDLGLLRLLIGLDKRKVLIFVNKVDEIEANSDTLAQIESNIRSLLDTEFPGYAFPVVFGSALWAREAIAAAQKAAADEADMPSIFSLKPSQALASWLDPNRFEAAIEPDRLMRRSGLIKLALTISDLVRGGRIAEQLQFKAEMLQLLCCNLIASRRLLQQVAYGHDAQNARHHADIDRLRQLHQALAAEVALSRHHLEELVSGHIATLRQVLSTSLQDGVHSSIAEFPTIKPHAQLRSADRAIRRKLQDAFADAKERIAEALRAALDDIARRLETAVAVHGGGLSVIRPSSFDFLLRQTLSDAALNQPAMLDVAERLGYRDIGTTLNEQMRNEFSEALTANFEPIIAELSVSGQESLKSVISEVFLHFETILLKPLEALIADFAEAKSGEIASTAASGVPPAMGINAEKLSADMETLAAITRDISLMQKLLED